MPVRTCLGWLTRRQSLKITISLGMAVCNGHESHGEFYRRADKLLYRARRLVGSASLRKGDLPRVRRK